MKALTIVTTKLSRSDGENMQVLPNTKTMTTGEHIARAICSLMDSKLNLAAGGNMVFFTKQHNEAMKAIADGIDFQLRAKKAHDSTMDV